MANNRPPFIKGKKVTAPNMTRHDSYSCALDLLAFTNHGEASINWEGKGVEEDTVYLAYQELKGNKTLSNELKKKYRSSAKINPPKYVPSC